MGSAEPLETWTVATFNVVTFGLVAVVVGHLSGGLGDSLRGLGTLAGAVTFGYLWVLVVVSTRWALADGGLERARADGTGSLALRGTAAGALVGGGFVLGVVLVGGTVGLLSGRFEPVTVGLVALLGGAIGAAVGAVVGVVFVLVDVALYRAVAALTPRPAA